MLVTVHQGSKPLICSLKDQDTILDLKLAIHTAQKTSVSAQIITYSGSPLNDSIRLQDVDLSQHSVLHVDLTTLPKLQSEIIRNSLANNDSLVVIRYLAINHQVSCN